jgi:hypothetical protein
MKALATRDANVLLRDTWPCRRREVAVAIGLQLSADVPRPRCGVVGQAARKLVREIAAFTHADRSGAATSLKAGEAGPHSGAGGPYPAYRARVGTPRSPPAVSLSPL